MGSRSLATDDFPLYHRTVSMADTEETAPKVLDWWSEKLNDAFVDQVVNGTPVWIGFDAAADEITARVIPHDEFWILGESATEIDGNPVENQAESTS